MYYKNKYEKKDKEKIRNLEKKKIEIEMNMKNKELNRLKKEESELSTEILHITNRFPYLKLKLKEIQEQIKQISSS